ncbi:ribokinase [Leucobacter exalbidus]|uniref:Ribokinase n=1 Tax=Leucobacter exalbidus TaxID=662960 RepID=A0A940T372_9MICO|nr:ribokinase [Leucobacter exalbidus]
MSVHTPRVAVIGSANADLVVEVARRPGGGETLLGGDLALLPGGKGANQAAAAARCGANVSMVACVGTDSNGGFLLSELTAAGVNVEHVARVERPTGTAIILLTPDGENSIVVSPGANQALDVAAVEAAVMAAAAPVAEGTAASETGEASPGRAGSVWRDAQVVVLSLEIPLETALHVASEAHAAGARVVLNAAPSVQLTGDVLQLCDPLIVNEHEALEVLGASADDPDATNYARLAERLLIAGARSVVVTLGADGAIVAERGASSAAEEPLASLTAVPAYTVRAVDTTGAGDAFVGAVAGELAAGQKLADAVRFATAVSAVSVQRVGAQSSYADRTEIEAFIVERSA